MTFPPALAVVLVVALLSASLFHAVFGRSWRGLGISIVAALGGFAVGETVARALAQNVAMVGQVHLAHGLLGCWVAMIVAWLRGG